MPFANLSFVTIDANFLPNTMVSFVIAQPHLGFSYLHAFSGKVDSFAGEKQTYGITDCCGAGEISTHRAASQGKS